MTMICNARENSFEQIMYRRVFRYLTEEFRCHDNVLREKSLVAGTVLPTDRYEESILFGAGLSEPTKPNPRFGGRWLAARGPLTADYFLAAGLPVARFHCDAMLLIKHTIQQAEYRRRGILQAMNCLWAKGSLRRPDVPTPFSFETTIHNEPHRTLYMIAQSEGVITDSLAVVMVADSLNVPVVYWRTHALAEDETFPALDYAAATGRKSFILWDADLEECHARLAETKMPRIPDTNRLLTILENFS